MKRCMLMLLVACMVFIGVGSPVYATELLNEEKFTEDTTLKQYYKVCVDDNDNIYIQEVDQKEFQSFAKQRGTVYAEGWEVMTISGYVAAYVTLYYQTVESGGKKVFDLNNTYFECTEMNGYVGALEILGGTLHSFHVKYEFLNLLGESGYREKWFYPQQ